MDINMFNTIMLIVSAIGFAAAAVFLVLLTTRRGDGRFVRRAMMVSLVMFTAPLPATAYMIPGKPMDQLVLAIGLLLLLAGTLVVTRWMFKSTRRQGV